MTISVLGIDPAFAHMGLANAVIDPGTNQILRPGPYFTLISTEGRDKKVVRKNSDDLRRAKELHQALTSACARATIAFAEIPQGSQSARASWSLGITIGVLATCPIPLIQVTPTEVKLATVGSKQASKQDMIDWAYNKWPQANWIKVRNRLTLANEHLADALAVIYAGMKTEEFNQLRAWMMLPKTLDPNKRARVIVHR